MNNQNYDALLQYVEAIQRSNELIENRLRSLIALVGLGLIYYLIVNWDQVFYKAQSTNKLGQPLRNHSGTVALPPEADIRLILL